MNLSINKIQKNDSYCGPAVLQSLLGQYQRFFSQDEIAAAAGNLHNITEDGTRPYQLSQAVNQLAPDLQFWFKQSANRYDLSLLTKKFNLPVIVSWQGLFYDSQEEQEIGDPEGEHGHYAIVIDCTPTADEIVIADPYSEKSHQPRLFSLKWFENRWWDEVEDTNPYTRQVIITKTDHFLACITHKNHQFPPEMRMMLPDQLDILTQSRR